MRNTDFRLSTSDWLRRAAHVLMYAVLGLMALFTEREFFKLTPVDVVLGLAVGLWGLAVVLDYFGRARSPSAPDAWNDGVGTKGRRARDCAPYLVFVVIFAARLWVHRRYTIQK